MTASPTGSVTSMTVSRRSITSAPAPGSAANTRIPKTSPIRKIGMKDTSGAPSTMPNIPSWKTSTVAPSVASTDSRNPSVAVSGTRIDRNTSMSSRNASPMTTAR